MRGSEQSWVMFGASLICVEGHVKDDAGEVEGTGEGGNGRAGDEASVVRAGAEGRVAGQLFAVVGVWDVAI